MEPDRSAAAHVGAHQWRGGHLLGQRSKVMPGVRRSRAPAPPLGSPAAQQLPDQPVPDQAVHGRADEPAAGITLQPRAGAGRGHLVQPGRRGAQAEAEAAVHRGRDAPVDPVAARRTERQGQPRRVILWTRSATTEELDLSRPCARPARRPPRTAAGERLRARPGTAGCSARVVVMAAHASPFQ